MGVPCLTNTRVSVYTMPQEIANIKWKLLCISNLGEEADRSAAAEWEKRFDCQHALWVRAHAESGETSAAIAKRIAEQIVQARLIISANDPVMAVLFLDLSGKTDEKAAELLQAMLGVPAVLADNLHCRMTLSPVFAWMGGIAFGDRASLRENTMVLDRLIVGAGGYFRRFLCLTGTTLYLTQKRAWKAVMFFLDVLRRLESPETFIPRLYVQAEHVTDGVGSPAEAGHVGFLRYGENNESDLLGYQEQLGRVERRLSDAGADDLEAALVKERERIRKAVEESFPVAGSMQPLHPDLFVEGWLRKKRAAKGKDRRYIDAQRETRAALLDTGERLLESVCETVLPTAETAGTILKNLFSEASVGIELEWDPDKIRKLLCVTEGGTKPMPPSLSYQEKSPEKEVTSYLLKMRSHACQQALMQFEQLLWDAYPHHGDDNLSVRADLLEQKRHLEREIDYCLTADELLTMLQNRSDMPESGFSPTKPEGESIRLAVTHTRKYCDALDRHCGYETTAYYLPAEDPSSPLEGLQFFLFTCDDDMLKDLLGE